MNKDEPESDIAFERFTDDSEQISIQLIHHVDGQQDHQHVDRVQPSCKQAQTSKRCESSEHVNGCYANLAAGRMEIETRGPSTPSWL